MDVVCWIGRRLLWALPALTVVAILIAEIAVYASFAVPVGEQNGMLAGLLTFPFVAVLVTSLWLLTELACSRPLCAWRAWLVAS